MQLQPCEGLLLRPDGPVISLRVREPTGIWGKARGLIGSPPLHAHEAMLLRPCRAVTMLFMGYPILAVYLSAEGGVLGCEVLRPWTPMGHAPKGTRSVLETSPKLASSITEGMRFLWAADGVATEVRRFHTLLGVKSSSEEGGRDVKAQNHGRGD